MVEAMGVEPMSALYPLPSTPCSVPVFTLKASSETRYAQESVVAVVTRSYNEKISLAVSSG